MLTMAFMLVGSFAFANQTVSINDLKSSEFVKIEISIQDPEPLIVNTTCGKSLTVDSAGMTQDEIFDLAFAADFIMCELPKILGNIRF